MTRRVAMIVSAASVVKNDTVIKPFALRTRVLCSIPGSHRRLNGTYNTSKQPNSSGNRVP